ncbi:hypothetical protein HDU99_010845 [Rhizoclosmatium hyalinum]|nr:hypothetical protein HDU99_010845 [Rhizoclosmatium hyalinum]
MPICGGSPNLPDLSNKANYPFYFRVAYSNKWGSDIASLLQEWNVKRVALVYDADDSESVGGIDPRLKLMEGMIYVASKNLPALDPNFKAIQSRWEKLYKADPLKYQIDYLTWTNKGTFDCVGTLLYGFDKVSY